MPKPKNEGYLGNINVKRQGVTEEWTDDKVQEYLKCTREPAYFISKYLKIISLDEGLVPFELYDYQQGLIQHFEDNRFNIVLACRQSGKSITVCISSLVFTISSRTNSSYSCKQRCNCERNVISYYNYVRECSLLFTAWD